MKEIKLTKNQKALVDDEDYTILKNYNWYANYTRSGNVYAKGYYNRKPRSMHSVILEINNIQSFNNKITIDHKNRNSLDNQKSNLRYTTYTENNVNRAPSNNIHKTSKYKGVSKCSSKYRATVRCEGKIARLGIYLTEEDAAKVHDAVTRYYYPNIGYTNFTGKKTMNIAEAKQYYENYKKHHSKLHNKSYNKIKL
jgi:hypothetical protein